MNLPLNVDVHCTDGLFGRSTYIIYDPTTEKATHFVVKRQKSSQTERMVPVSWIKESTPELILLSHPRAEVENLEPFNRTEFVQRDVPHYAADPQLTLLWPFRVPAKRIVADTYRQIPAGEFAVRRGARVRATDGRVGQVDEFMIDPDSGHITHLVLREGLPWDRRHVDIPVSAIERIEENVVYLKLDKKSIEALPFIQLRRW
jgi:sporulation protein YlmC with PRC-barrel domain